MRTVRIPKRNGEFRTIYVPSPQCKRRLRALVPELEMLAKTRDVHGVQHGFVPMRSPVTNALAHVGYEYTVSFDLKNFFDSVSKELFEDFDLPEEAEMFQDSAARQGLPTSPSLANIAAGRMDESLIESIGHEVIYTRYADDLTFSCHNREGVDELLRIVPQVVEDAGFVVNERKTRVQCASQGRRVITGIAVDSDAIFPTRKAKRRLRAALNRHDNARANGLAEWIKLKPPKVGRAFRRAMRDVAANNLLPKAAEFSKQYHN